jgi:hypothetical protein
MRHYLRIILCTTCLALAFPTAATLQIAAAQTIRTRARATSPAHSSAPATKPAAPPATCTSCTPPIKHVQPYTATQETTRTHTLSDGTTVKTVEETTLARDALGRTRTETVRTLNGEITHSFEIFDAFTQTRYTWTVGANQPQVVTVSHVQPDPQDATPPPPTRYYPTTTETLSPQTISDLYVEGTRTTRTTPAGYEGNDREIVTTTESWIAPALGLQMRLIIDDPRTGKVTTETSDVKQADPDPTLFHPPAGYQIKDAAP